ERTIRDAQELEQTRQYIRNNPIELKQKQKEESQGARTPGPSPEGGRKVRGRGQAPSLLYTVGSERPCIVEDDAYSSIVGACPCGRPRGWVGRPRLAAVFTVEGRPHSPCGLT